MSYPRYKLPRAEGGAALVVAMLVFALVAALMVGLQRDFTLTLQRGAHQLFSEQAGLISLVQKSWRRWHCRQIVAPMPEPRLSRTTLEKCGRSLRRLIHLKPVAG